MKYETFDDLFADDEILTTRSENVGTLKKAQAEFHKKIGYRKSVEPSSSIRAFAALVALTAKRGDFCGTY